MTYRNELQRLIDDDDRETDVEYCLPFGPVQRRDGEQRLYHDSQIRFKYVGRMECQLTVKKGM